MQKILSECKSGDIVRVNLEPTVGDEKHKERFCLVLEDGSSPLNLIIILPITRDNGKRTGGFYVPITDLKQAGLNKPSVVDCYQIRTIAIERLVKNKSESFIYGKINESIMFEIRKKLALLLDIGEEHISAL